MPAHTLLHTIAGKRVSLVAYVTCFRTVGVERTQVESLSPHRLESQAAAGGTGLPFLLAGSRMHQYMCFRGCVMTCGHERALPNLLRTV